jgi:hypothetical protein
MGIAKGDNMRLQSDLDAANDEKANLQPELDTRGDRNETLLSELETVEGEKVNLQSELDRSCDTNEMLQSELDMSKDDAAVAVQHRNSDKGGCSWTWTPRICNRSATRGAGALRASCSRPRAEVPWKGMDWWPEFPVLVGSIEKILDYPNTSKALEYFGCIGGIKQALFNVLLSWGLDRYDAFALYSFDKLLWIAVQFLHCFRFDPEGDFKERVFVKKIVTFREDLSHSRVFSQVGLILKENLLIGCAFGTRGSSTTWTF